MKYIKFRSNESNPGGQARFRKADKEELRETLSELQYKVTMEAATEAPFSNEYHDNEEAGLYVDITTGEPLFSSDQKFNSHCGWPSFTAPLETSLIDEHLDLTHGMRRVEVRSSLGDAHLGHVFTDGPEEFGGLRYCINSASLRFIPLDRLDEEGYGEWKNKIQATPAYPDYDSHSIRQAEKERERLQRERENK